MKYYLYNKNRYFTGSKDYPVGIKPKNGTEIAPNNEPNQKWMGNHWANIPLPQKSFEVQQAELIKKIQTKYQDIIDTSKVSYSEYEIETFSIQETEWKAWSADNTSGTPFIDTIATARGIDRLELLGKIGANTLAVATTLGQQQAEETIVKACTTVEELRGLSL